MEKTKTAMQQLIEYIQSKKRISEFAKNVELKAIELRDTVEKEQIIEARQDGHDSTYAEYGETPKCYLDGSHIEYYEQTYGNENT